MTHETMLTPWRLESVDAAAMVDWVDLLRDANPIHVDPAAAEALGFGRRTVNPGPANLAYLLTMLAAARPDDYPTHIAARFHGNVFSDDTVEARGTRDGAAYTLRLHSGEGDAVAVEATVTLAPIAPDGST